MTFKYLHETAPGMYYLDHRLVPEVRGMLAAMVSRAPIGGVKARYAQMVDSVALDLIYQGLSKFLDSGTLRSSLEGSRIVVRNGTWEHVSISVASELDTISFHPPKFDLNNPVYAAELELHNYMTRSGFEEGVCTIRGGEGLLEALVLVLGPLDDHNAAIRTQTSWVNSVEEFDLDRAEDRLTEYPLHPKVHKFFDDFVSKYGHSSIMELVT